MALRDWFVVAHLMINAKKGISSLNVKRTIGCKKEKTAWYYVPSHPRRDEGFATLPGVLEVDEAFVEFAHHQPTAL